MARKMDLKECYIFHGNRYGPGAGVAVPDDFPKEPPVRRSDHSQLVFKAGTSGSGIAEEDAPEENYVDSEGHIQHTKDGQLPGESNEDFEKRAGEDKELRDDAAAEARKQSIKDMKTAGKEAKKEEK